MKSIIGITGGIGSGKTFLASKLQEKFPVYYSDAQAKELMNYHTDLKNQIIETFGSKAYNKNGLDRTYLAHTVFNNQESLKKLNSIVHPAVRKHCDEWCTNQKCNIVFVEAAILFETGRYKDFRANILVTANQNERIERVIQRDKVSKSEVLARISKQAPDTDKIPLADFVFNNSKGRFDAEFKRLQAWLNQFT